MKKYFIILLITFMMVGSIDSYADIEIRDGRNIQRFTEADGVGTSSDPYLPTHSDFYFQCATGNITGCSVVHQSGHNDAVGTSFVPVSFGGVYRTPQVSGATTLRIKAGGNANDTAAGTGAREVTFEGLDETGTFVTEAVATAGASASAATTTTFIRMFKSYVSASGTYATATTGSHSAEIVIENSAGTEDWATIKNTSFSRSQTEIAAYTVPLGKVAYITSVFASVDSNKVADVLFFHRGNILETAAPYTSMKVGFEVEAVSGDIAMNPKTPLGVYPALTDIWFMSKVPSGTASVDINYEIILFDE